MITIKEGDLFSAPRGIICHQVNCMGVMGRGVAKTFKEKFPQAFKEYEHLCSVYKCYHDSYRLLGTILVTENVHELRTTCCMFAQLNWRGHTNVCNTEYAAFRECCKRIAAWMDGSYSKDYPINVPYKIGCGLAGGDWDIVYSILEEELHDYNVILWKLEKENK